MMKQNYTPTTQSERVALLDILRGFAVFGILMVNLPLMLNGIFAEVFSVVNDDISISQMICCIFVQFFFAGKFYIIFSLLFGYGFWLFMNKKTDTERGILPIFRRRLLFLLIFGIGHIAFFWAGDILLFYALFGFILILFRKSSNKKIFVWSMVFLSIPIVSIFLVTLAFTMLAHLPEAQLVITEVISAHREEIKNIMEIYSMGNYVEVMNARIEEYKLIFNASILSPVPLAMFLIGVLIAKKGYISNWVENLPKIQKFFWWTLGVGIFINIICTILLFSVKSPTGLTWKDMLLVITTLFGGITFAFCYGSGIILLFSKQQKNYFFDLLSSVGRMALTNYLCQSIIVAFLAYSFGLGLFGKIAMWQCILLVITIFVSQAYISRWWLKKFYFGPFEWLWRSLTYLKIQPFQRK